MIKIKDAVHCSCIWYWYTYESYNIIPKIDGCKTICLYETEVLRWVVHCCCLIWLVDLSILPICAIQVFLCNKLVRLAAFFCFFSLLQLFSKRQLNWLLLLCYCFSICFLLRFSALKLILPNTLKRLTRSYCFKRKWVIPIATWYLCTISDFLYLFPFGVSLNIMNGSYDAVSIMRDASSAIFTGRKLKCDGWFSFILFSKISNHFAGYFSRFLWREKLNSIQRECECSNFHSCIFLNNFGNAVE